MHSVSSQVLSLDRLLTWFNMTDLEILNILEKLGITDPTFFYEDEAIKLSKIKKLREIIGK